MELWFIIDENGYECPVTSRVYRRRLKKDYEAGKNFIEFETGDHDGNILHYLDFSEEGRKAYRAMAPDCPHCKANDSHHHSETLH